MGRSPRPRHNIRTITMTYYTAVIILTWMALIILSVLALENDRITTQQKKILCLTYMAVAAAALAEWLGIMFNGNPDVSPWLIKIVKCADYILTPLAGGVILVQFGSREPVRTLILTVIFFNTGFQVASLGTDWMIKLNEQNYYSHGKLYMLYVVLYVFMLFLIAAEYLRYGYRFRKQNTLSLFLTIIMIFVGIILQEVIGGGIRTAYLGLALGAAMLFIHNSEYSQMATDDTLKEQRFRILMSQIKPHFLYNTLGAIQELCLSDPTQAMHATATFSRYLRGNMDSLSYTGLIPFEKELEHTRLYLELEKMRFEDALRIISDIRCTNFEVPPLTLQPIAENAVRHGVRGRRGGIGTVRLSTGETPDSYLVTVEDNGPGFDPSKPPKSKDGESHVGITNVRERLAEMCGGKLIIDSQPGKGTRATIVIPKNQRA